MAALTNDVKDRVPVAIEPFVTQLEDPAIDEKKDLTKEEVVQVVSMVFGVGIYTSMLKRPSQSPVELQYLDDTPGGLLSRVTPQDLEEAEEYAKTLTLEEVKTVSVVWLDCLQDLG